MFSKSTRKENPGIVKRFIRSIIAVTILTALVLGVSYLVKGLSTLDSNKAIKITKPLLTRIGISEEKAGEVAGAFTKRISDTNILFGSATSKSNAKKELGSSSSSKRETGNEKGNEKGNKKKLFSVALMADSEDDNSNLEKALKLAKEHSVESVFFLGDYTKWGDVTSLENAKKVMDNSGLSHYSLPGDHDLASSVNDGDQNGLKNFKNVFGNDSQSIVVKGYKFVLLNNSANYSVINSEVTSWFNNELKDAKFILLSQPLYHPTLNLIMGKVAGSDIPKVREQAVELLRSIRNSDSKAIIAADQHSSSLNVDPEDKTLQHIVVGALISNDDSIRNLQSPRFSILDVYDDESFNVSDVVLE